jgi:hypothetical protein
VSALFVTAADSGRDVSRATCTAISAEEIWSNARDASVSLLVDTTLELTVELASGERKTKPRTAISNTILAASIP